jgi:hypothetical protein
VNKVTGLTENMHHGIFGTETHMIGVLCDPSLGMSVSGSNSLGEPISKPLDGISTTTHNWHAIWKNTSATTEAHLGLSFNPCYLALSRVK